MSLQFSDTTTKNGLIQTCEITLFDNYGDISSNSDRLYTFTRLLNEALNRVTSLILRYDGRWQFDDTNNTDLPIGTTNLVTTVGSEQQDYAISVSHLKILSVEIKDASGGWHTLQPIDQTDLYNTNITDFLSSPGLPQYYDKIGNSIFLYPKPLGTAVTSTAGLKVRYQRPPSYFTYTDTTKTPGFNSLYHVLVAMIACRDYALDKSLASANSLTERVKLLEESLGDSYAFRGGDEKPSIRNKGRIHNFI